MTARRGILASAACVVLCVPASASDVTAAVKQWMGKWPNEPFNQQLLSSAQTPGSHDRRTFWQFPGTRAGLEEAVGKKRAAVLIGVWRTSDNLKMAGARWATFAGGAWTITGGGSGTGWRSTSSLRSSPAVSGSSSISKRGC